MMIRLTRAAMLLVSLFGKGAWGLAQKAVDLPPPAPVKVKRYAGRHYASFHIHAGGCSIRKVQRFLAAGGGPIYTAEDLASMAARHIHPRHKRGALALAEAAE